MSRSFTANALIVISMRWSERLLGLLSMVVLARLLTPADFGLVAIAWVVIELLDLVTDLGVNVAIIRKVNPDDDYYDTAWTMRLIQMIFAALVVFFGAGQFAEFFGDTRLEHILEVLALFFFIGGLENIRIVDFQKHMNFGKDFIFFVARKLPTIIITISLALAFQSYWALIIGSIAGKIISVAVSYAMVRRAPRFCLSAWRNIFNISKWVLIRSILLYIDNNIPKILIGKLLTTDSLGHYTLSAELAAIPTTEVLAPINRVLFPTLAKNINDSTETIRTLSRVLATQAYIALPAAFGIYAIANDFITVVLGQQWSAAGSILGILAFASAIGALSSCASYLLLADGRLSILAAVSLLQIVVFASIIFLPQVGLDIEHVAEARLASILFGAFCLFTLISWSAQQPFFSVIIKSLFRPLAAAIVMFSLLNWITPVLSEWTVVIRLLTNITLGAMIFVLTSYTLWFFQGKPDGPERFVIDEIQMRWRAR